MVQMLMLSKTVVGMYNYRPMAWNGDLEKAQRKCFVSFATYNITMTALNLPLFVSFMLDVLVVLFPACGFQKGVGFMHSSNFVSTITDFIASVCISVLYFCPTFPSKIAARSETVDNQFRAAISGIVTIIALEPYRKAFLSMLPTKMQMSKIYSMNDHVVNVKARETPI
ncbi:unnamed protein product [Gongylonema pulchrum]|uniref:7TM_GPCR_Srx domain-containing protein n=1 Tax=Gongylonema pulchrum TaxID=637853 RepID=A0A183CWV8_9BILA|nr:unnamed protein product [Gongylonema pulchrum]